MKKRISYETEKRARAVSYTDSAGREVSLYGELYLPKAEGKFPAVILCHGFNGHFRDFPAECRRFGERGFICYAFDFCGAQSGGASTGRTASEYTPFTMKEDLKAVIADIKRLEQVDEAKIFLFGGSQGGFVTALTAADEEIGAQVAGLALYFPALNIPDDWRNAPIRDTPLMGYLVGERYIRSIRGTEIYSLIGNYKKDVCIVWGDEDGIVKRNTIERAVAAYGKERVELTIIKGAGHGFTGEALTLAVEKVLSFLELHT